MGLRYGDRPLVEFGIDRGSQPASACSLMAWRRVRRQAPPAQPPARFQPVRIRHDEGKDIGDFQVTQSIEFGGRIYRCKRQPGNVRHAGQLSNRRAHSGAIAHYAVAHASGLVRHSDAQQLWMGRRSRAGGAHADREISLVHLQRELPAHAELFRLRPVRESVESARRGTAIHPDPQLAARLLQPAKPV